MPASMLIILISLTIMTPASLPDSLAGFDIQGHRGARGLVPENTIPSFLTALELGVTTLEMDVVITSDHHVLLSHEPWFSAEICTGPDGSPVTSEDERSHNIYAMTLEEAQRYDCGARGPALSAADCDGGR
jgi:glycerophosphoryl diester phosphodiesterase